jgi:hypothetical protein
MPIAGVLASRSIDIFLPTVRAEIETTKQQLQAGAAMMKANALPKKEAEYLAAAPRLIKAKYKMMLSHEMVHIFATDEYHKIMDVLGLEQLELLTDSINLLTFYPDYKKANNFAKAGVAEGIGYLANLMHASVPGRQLGPELVDMAYERAKGIVQKCREKLAAQPA